MKNITAPRSFASALVILLVSIFCLTGFVSASAESEEPIRLEDVIGVWELEGVYRNGEVIYSAEDILRTNGRPITVEFTTDGLWILDGAEQIEVYDVSQIQDNILPDGSSLTDEILSIAVTDIPGTTMRCIRSSLPGRESTAEVDPASVGFWVMKELELRNDSTTLAVLAPEEFSARYNIAVPTAEVRKCGFILMTLDSKTEIFPANQWEQAEDLLIWNDMRADGKALVWTFIRENAAPASND